MGHWVKLSRDNLIFSLFAELPIWVLSAWMIILKFSSYKNKFVFFPWFNNLSSLNSFLYLISKIEQSPKFLQKSCWLKELGDVGKAHFSGKGILLLPLWSTFFFFVFFFFSVLEIEPGALHILGNRSTTELHSQPLAHFLLLTCPFFFFFLWHWGLNPGPCVC
jgi:hypothetical protein